MLQAMRDKVMGWLGWIIIGLIIITFALFGLGSYLQDKTRIYAAKVNDVEITPGALQNAYQQQRAQVQQMLGDNFDPRLISEEALRERALSSLISRSLLVQAAGEDGMVIGDQLLAAQIHAIPLFQEDGVFSDARYQQFLYQQGQTPAAFEADTRRGLLAEQLVSALSRSEFVTSAEVQLAYALQNQQRDFSYVVVAAGPFEANQEVGDAAIQRYFDEHADELMLPERVRLEYVRLTRDQLGSDIPIDDAELQAYYEEQKASLETQEQRQASHILLQVAPDADDETIAKVKAEAESLLARIRGGEEFSALAREYSDDPGSAANGGDLGFFAKGAMVPEFEQTVFGLEKGQVSDIVRTQFGFHIIKLADIRGSDIAPLEQVRDELIARLQKRYADDVFYEKLEQLTDVSYESPDSLDAAAEAVGLEIQTSDWITATGGPGIGAYANLVAAAFSEDVLEVGNNSEPVEVADGDAIVVRVAEHEPAQRPPLETVRDQIVTALKAQQAREQARAEGESLLQKLAQGTSMEELEGEVGQTVTRAQGAQRSTPGYHPEILRQAFKLPRPEAGATVDHGMQLANGDYAIIRLTGVQDGDPATMPEESRQQIVRSYENLRETVNVSALVESLRAKAEIVIPSEQEE